MVDLVVIGGGFWGVATTIKAQRAGIEVLVLDDANPRGASRNAAGIVCKHWYKQDTILGMTPEDWGFSEVEAGIDFLSEFGLERTGERFTSYQNTSEKHREDCYLIRSPDSLLGVVRPVITKVDRIVQGEVLRVITPTKDYTTRSVVVAAGAFTDEVLLRSGLQTLGVRPLRGRALVAKVSGGYIETPHTHLVRPYTHMTARRWPGVSVRLGDSVERGSGDRQLDTLRQALRLMCPNAVETSILDGLRPVCDKFFVGLVAPRIVAATGGHRVGLALAGAVADRCLGLLKIKNPSTLLA